MKGENLELWAGKLIECSRLHELVVQDNWRETDSEGLAREVSEGNVRVTQRLHQGGRERGKER